MNFLLVTAATQVFISFLSCFYVNRKHINKVDKPLSQIEKYLNNLTKNKILVSYWKIEHIRTEKRIISLGKKKVVNKVKPAVPEQRQSA